MPRYDFRNIETDEDEVHWMMISELDKFKSDNPHLVQKLTNLNMADPTRLSLHKPDQDFRDILKNVSKKNPRSTINTW